MQLCAVDENKLILFAHNAHSERIFANMRHLNYAQPRGLVLVGIGLILKVERRGEVRRMRVNKESVWGNFIQLIMFFLSVKERRHSPLDHHQIIISSPKNKEVLLPGWVRNESI